MCFHVVRAADGHHFVPKTALTFKDSYVDIREFDIVKWREHVPLAEAIIQSDKRQLIQNAATTAVENAFDHVLDRR